MGDAPRERAQGRDVAEDNSPAEVWDDDEAPAQIAGSALDSFPRLTCCLRSNSSMAAHRGSLRSVKFCMVYSGGASHMISATLKTSLMSACLICARGTFAGERTSPAMAQIESLSHRYLSASA